MSIKIGNSQHKLFPLSEALGSVTGVQSMSFTEEKIDAGHLTKFSYLGEGETLTLEGVQSIEVVDFAYTNSGRASEHLILSQRLGLKETATLTGPLAWREDHALKAPTYRGWKIPKIIPYAVMAAAFGVIAFNVHEVNILGGVPFDPIETMGDNMGWFCLLIIGMMGRIVTGLESQLSDTLKATACVEVHAPARRLWA